MSFDTVLTGCHLTWEDYWLNAKRHCDVPTERKQSLSAFHKISRCVIRYPRPSSTTDMCTRIMCFDFYRSGMEGVNDRFASLVIRCGVQRIHATGRYVMLNAEVCVSRNETPYVMKIDSAPSCYFHELLSFVHRAISRSFCLLWLSGYDHGLSIVRSLVRIC